MFIKPREGYVILDPYTREPLAADGEEKDATDGYWQRRLRDGDVVPALPPPTPSAPVVDMDPVVLPEGPA